MIEVENENTVAWRFPENASWLRTYLYRITESNGFGATILIIILLNTVVLLAQVTNDAVRIHWGWWFSCFDFAFLAVYTMEFVLKFYALRFQYFASGANKLDFIIVLFTLLDFILPLIVQSAGVLDVAVLFKLMKVGRSIRAIRAVRVLRTIRFLKNLQVIFNTVMKSIRALSTIAFLALLVIYMFAVIGRGLFYNSSHERFGDIYKAFLTLFQLMTLDDWFQVFLDNDVGGGDGVCDDPPCSHNSWVLLIYMVVFIFLQYFIFLNLLVAVIVDNFQRTLAAADEAKPKKSTSSRRTALFVTDGEEEDPDEDFSAENVERESDSTISNHPIIEDFYPENYIPERRDRELLQRFFTQLSMLEYNIHQNHVQQKLLDDLVDITVTMTDAPEDLI